MAKTLKIIAITCYNASMMKKLQSQIALFFEDSFSGQLDTISTKIREELKITSNPTILPSAEGVPDEFPVLTVNDGEKSIDITLTKKRFDLHIPFDNFDPKSIESIIKCFNSMSSKINKVGVVLTCIRSNESKDLIKEQFKELDQNIEDVYVRFKINKNLNGLNITLFDTYSNGKVENKLSGEKLEGLILIRDYILEVQKGQITAEDFANFYSELIKDSDTVVF